MSHGWHTGIFDCFAAGEACLHWFSGNCITYGETHYRLTYRDDPELINFNPLCNIPCWICIPIGIVPGGACLMEMLQRTKLRNQLGIEGSKADDCVKSYLCHCCGLVQEDMEAKAWQERRGPYAVDAQPVGNKESMTYDKP